MWDRLHDDLKQPFRKTIFLNGHPDLACRIRSAWAFTGLKPAHLPAEIGDGWRAPQAPLAIRRDQSFVCSEAMHAPIDYAMGTCPILRCRMNGCGRD